MFDLISIIGILIVAVIIWVLLSLFFKTMKLMIKLGLILVIVLVIAHFVLGIF
ncbi:hypothetical protein [Methanococcus voltae]|uniref:Glucan phosphoethanolaminetransferase (Alkaline phosphatase superfamily) n=2 Tax=Methanococcus voltae TaxID=2188 RepID=A0A8J7S5H6_METVO|nr:hypothetical protein [Methanococcus voltae]MBP2172837.1 glucan phosphoethanolaminetransferase (alkaline phosphatase superfamily) [Methanococcus voltae]MBP2201753.1 glucan phosphoethanolaminetransferase (alkaline phosphatase superfamily) [Methanococcus voltae]MCS3922541.1 glucan phosphoethanolaminetransferase (alkaline phosphatase superfamily) [Methanococcus voltae PS]